MKTIYPIWHPYTQHALAGEPVKIARAEGIYLYKADGTTILDAISSWWVNIHGHCHPKIVKAVRDQAAALDQVIFAGFTHEPAERLGQALLSFTGDAHSHVFFSDSGSTAVEVALKMAIGARALQGRKRRKILALEGGYHGDTFGAMAAGGRGIFNALYEDYLFDVIHLPFPAAGHEETTMKALDAILAREGGDIAAFIFEPLVQGAAGMRFYSMEALKKMMQACAARGIFLIADEVMTGFGRTGARFVCAQAGIKPDILCLSKGLTGGFLPLGATLCTPEIYNAFLHKDRARMFFHSSSYTGNALACAAGLASLQIWDEEDTDARIQAINARHKEAVECFSKNGAAVNVRSLGTIFALDIKQEEAGYLSAFAPKLYDFFLKRGVLLRPLGNTVYILPPYCVTASELERIYDVIDQALNSLQF